MASSPRAARSRADALGRAKERLSEAAMAEVRATIRAWWPEGTELTDETIEVICDVVEAYAGDAYGYAVQYWEEQIGSEPGIGLSDVYSREWTRKEMRSSAEAAGDDHSVIARRLADHASRMVGRVCGDYVVRSARRRPTGRGGQVRFARVPGWSETCSWCLMLASRGWVYWSRKTAGEFEHYHAHCRCVVVASDEDHPALDGYDPDGLYERYLACRNAVDNEIQQLHGDDVTKAIIREMARRDPVWLRTGRPVPPDMHNLTDNDVKIMKKKGEYESYDRLWSNGIEAIPQNEHGNQVKHIDARIRGTWWEIKTIRGSGASVDKRFKNAIEKWRKLHAAGQLSQKSKPKVVLDVYPSAMNSDDAERMILKNMRKYVDDELNEVLLVTRDGSLRRYKV